MDLRNSWRASWARRQSRRSTVTALCDRTGALGITLYITHKLILKGHGHRGEAGTMFRPYHATVAIRARGPAPLALHLSSAPETRPTALSSALHPLKVGLTRVAYSCHEYDNTTPATLQMLRLACTAPPAASGRHTSTRVTATLPRSTLPLPAPVAPQSPTADAPLDSRS
jgi:hypothetical protein